VQLFNDAVTTSTVMQSAGNQLRRWAGCLVSYVMKFLQENMCSVEYEGKNVINSVCVRNCKYCCLPRSKALAFVKRGPISPDVANRENIKMSETRVFHFTLVIMCEVLIS
jgi:hypothetical protein